MKNKTLIGIQITLWTCIAIFLGSIFVYRLTTDSNMGVTPVMASGKEIEYEVSLQDIEEISLSLISQDVYIYESNDDKLYIKHYANKNLVEKEKLQVIRKGNKVSITKQDKINFNLFNFNRWGLNEQVEVYIPVSYKGNLDSRTVSGELELSGLTLDELSCHSTSGEIKLRDIKAKELSVNEVSGDLELNNVEAESIRTKTTSGDVTIKNVKIDRIKASQVSGNFEMKGIGKQLELNSISGEIEIDLDEMANEVQMETVSGDIELNIPENNGFELIFNTVSGDIKSNFDLLGSIKTKGNKYIYENGESQMSIRTTSGDLEINKK